MVFIGDRYLRRQDTSNSYFLLNQSKSQLKIISVKTLFDNLPTDKCNVFFSLAAQMQQRLNLEKNDFEEKQKPKIDRKSKTKPESGSRIFFWHNNFILGKILIETKTLM